MPSRPLLTLFEVMHFGFSADGLSVYLAQPVGLGTQFALKTKGPLALKLLKLDHSARWAGLCKLLGLRPEILKSII